MQKLKKMSKKCLNGLEKTLYGRYVVLGKGGVYEESAKYNFGKPISVEEKDIPNFDELKKIVDSDRVNIRYNPVFCMPWNIINGWDDVKINEIDSFILGDIPDFPDYISAKRIDYSSGVRVVNVEIGYFGKKDNSFRKFPYCKASIISKK